MSPAPSHGTKVDLGQNAPVKNEGAGLVQSESLAAESKSEGGEFASNEGIRTGNESSSTSKSQSTSKQPTSTSSNNQSSTTSASTSNKQSSTTSTSNQSSNKESTSSTQGSSGSAQESSGSSAGTAPTYVLNQYQRDNTGPHGKNLKEGIDDGKTEDGLKKALESEPGSENDPSRLAELQFQQNKTGGAPDNVGDKTAFDGLNAETPS